MCSATRFPFDFPDAQRRLAIPSMTRLGRILTVTAGLVVTGAAVGAVTGAVILLGWLAMMSRSGFFPVREILQVGALFGAGVGAILAPIASWTLLRRVPLGRAVMGAAFGTALGAIAGGALSFVGPAIGAIAGFAAGAIYLRVVVAPRIARNSRVELPTVPPPA